MSYHTRELGRKATGTALQWVLGLYGTAAATNVVIGNAETPVEKLTDALTAVPDLTQQVRLAKKAYEHRDEIAAMGQYLNEHVPTTQDLERIADTTYNAVEGIRVANEHFGIAYDNIMSLSWQPMETIGHFKDGWDALPSVDVITHLGEAAKYGSIALKQLSQLDIDPLYRAMINTADNFAADERYWTIGIAAGAVAVAYAAGAAIGQLWAKRGKPGMVSRFIQRLGVRTHRKHYEENIEEVLKDIGLHEIAKEHYGKAALQEPPKAYESTPTASD